MQVRHRGNYTPYLPHRMVGDSLFFPEIPDSSLCGWDDLSGNYHERLKISKPFFVLNRRGKIEVINDDIYFYNIDDIIDYQQVKLLYLYSLDGSNWNVGTAEDIETNWNYIAPLGFFSRASTGYYKILNYGNGCMSDQATFLPHGRILTPWGSTKPKGVIPKFEFSGIYHGMYYDEDNSKWYHIYGSFGTIYSCKTEVIAIQWTAYNHEHEPLEILKAGGVSWGYTSEKYLSDNGIQVIYCNMSILWYFLLREFYVRCY